MNGHWAQKKKDDHKKKRMAINKHDGIARKRMPMARGEWLQQKDDDKIKDDYGKRSTTTTRDDGYDKKKMSMAGEKLR